MSGKIIKISNCGACNYHYMSQLSENVTYCQHEDNQYDVATGGDPVIPDFPRIPDWCCLEDDLTPALDILQGHLNRLSYIDFDEDDGVFVCGLYKYDGDLIVSGQSIKELLINLVNLEGCNEITDK